jgi:flagellar biosynthesis protein FlhG
VAGKLQSRRNMNGRMKSVDGGKPRSETAGHPVSLSRPTCRSLAITSGKGGVGKTNVAANLALALARHNRRILLVDGDMSLANLDLLMGVLPQWNVQHVISGEKTIGEIIVPTYNNVRLVPAASGSDSLANLDDFRRECFLRSLSTIDGEIDLILIDTGSGIAKSVTGLALAADDIVVVTTPEPTSVSQAYAMMKVLSTHREPRGLKVLVNMAESAAQAAHVYSRICAVAEQFLTFAPENWGFIEYDPAVRKAVMNQEPFFLASPGCPAAAGIESLAQRVLEIEPEPRDSLDGWIERLKHAQAG